MDEIGYIFFGHCFFQGANVEPGKRDARKSRQISARALHAKVAAIVVMLGLAVALGERGALAQSGVIAGSALDPQSPSESLIPSGSFRLDGPSDAPPDDPNALWHAGTTSLGLQIYGSYNLQSHESDGPGMAAPIDGEPARP